MNLFNTKMTAVDDTRVTACENKRVNWNAGLSGVYKHSAETRANISAAAKTSLKAAAARVANCELARIANTGRKQTAEQRKVSSDLAKVREANRIISDETRSKLQKTNRILDVQTPNGVFPSRAAVARAAGVYPSTVSAWLKKYPKHYYYITEAAK